MKIEIGDQVIVKKDSISFGTLIKKGSIGEITGFKEEETGFFKKKITRLYTVSYPLTPAPVSHLPGHEWRFSGLCLVRHFYDSSVNEDGESENFKIQKKLGN